MCHRESVCTHIYNDRLTVDCKLPLYNYRSTTMKYTARCCCSVLRANRVYKSLTALPWSKPTKKIQLRQYHKKKEEKMKRECVIKLICAKILDWPMSDMRCLAYVCALVYANSVEFVFIDAWSVTIFCGRMGRECVYVEIRTQLYLLQKYQWPISVNTTDHHQITEFETAKWQTSLNEVRVAINHMYIDCTEKNKTIN